MPSRDTTSTPTHPTFRDLTCKLKLAKRLIGRHVATDDMRHSRVGMRSIAHQQQSRRKPIYILYVHAMGGQDARLTAVFEAAVAGIIPSKPTYAG